MATPFGPLLRKILIVTICVGGVGLSPRPGFSTTFGELMTWCSSPNEPLCDGYLSSIFQLLRRPDPVLNGGNHVCVPTDMPPDAVVPLLKAWRGQHPEAESRDIVEAVGAALVSRYPCK